MSLSTSTRAFGLAVVAAVLPLSLAVPASAADTSATTGGTIAVVPLDDRPVNMYAPAMTARVGGLAAEFPPRADLGHFTTPGNGAAVGQWLDAQTSVDAYVVSVSMLAYGGLIASRTATESAQQADANVQAIRTLRAERPDAPIFVFDTIQRLALTGLGGDQDYSNLVREWAILYDRVVNLGQTQYQSQLDQVRAQIPDQVLANYLAARKRNFEINQLMVHWVADGTISYLVLGEDDTAPYGLERAERVQLQQLVAQLGVGDRVQIFPGADEIDSLLTARYVLQHWHKHPTVSVTYGGVDGSAWTPPLEDVPFSVNIARHVTAMGGSVVTDPNPDLHLLVNTPAASGGDHAADLDKLVGTAKSLLQSGANVIVDDPLYVNRADHDLVTRLTSNLSVTDLLGFSGWNTAGNSLGLALSEGASRWALVSTPMASSTDADYQATNAQAEYLLHRFVLDDTWKNVIQPAAYAQARSMGANPYDLTPEQVPVLESFVRDRLVPATQSFFADYFKGRTLAVGIRGGSEHFAQIASLTSVDVSLPWPRLFETNLVPTTALVHEPSQPVS